MSKYSRQALGDLTPNNLGQVKALHNTVLPSIPHDDDFYKSALESGELSKLAYFNDISVGLVTSKKQDGVVSISEILVLEPYQRLGLDKTVTAVHAYVQKGNEGGLEFYKKNGFSIGEDVQVGFV
ncbi:N-alpha-acetyltransferase 50 [Rhizophlyctis rosea]|uniref:N-alpha-acetyltransferase 50 n=1 Tax=Rhizophlyctis rosea TaxID=64517 RepID=A0AAD5SDL4_9FUNG|nr:N-alpha-acetyltransferase 50 [Rhizophlyctis rosea]